MGKKDKKPKLSKKEQRKLEKKIAAKAEKKAAAKAEAKRAKMDKATKGAKVKGAERPTESAPSASSAADASVEQHPHKKHLARVGELTAIVADESAKKKDRKAAQAELDSLREAGEKINASKAEKTQAEQDAEMKERIQKRRAERAGSTENLRQMQQDTAERQAAAAKLTLADLTPEATLGSYPDAEAAHEADEAAERAAEEASTAVDKPVEFAMPSEAPGLPVSIPLTDDAKQYVILREDGTEGRYTRATTYIDGLEHTGALEAWKLRTLLEGIAVDNERTLADRDAANTMMGAITQSVHVRDVALAKLAKADRKGKLKPGERGLAEAEVNRAFKKVADEIAEKALDLGGAHVKANKGTDLHKLTEVCDLEGIERVRAMAEEGIITPADLADIEAYDLAIKKAGIKVLAVEQVVVDDERCVAGTTDRIVLAPGKLLGRSRGAKVIADVKTGNMEYAIGKTAMQITVYATSKAYTPGEVGRTDLGVLKPTAAKHPGKAPLKKDRPLKRDGVEAMQAYEARVEKYEADLAAYLSKRGVGLLIHLPAGQAQCTIHLVDLNVGAQGLKIIEQVRAWRNEGKRAIDLRADLLAEHEAAEASE